MFIHLLIELLCVVFGYMIVSKAVPKAKRIWGGAVFIAITLILPALTPYIDPMPFGILIFLSAYVALGVAIKGVGIKGIDKPEDDEDKKKNDHIFKA